jgi:hypothetical protein
MAQLDSRANVESKQSPNQSIAHSLSQYLCYTLDLDVVAAPKPPLVYISAALSWLSFSTSVQDFIPQTWIVAAFGDRFCQC